MSERSVIQSLESQIEKSRGQVTILFSDIEGSTAYWDTHGATAARLMIDRHNKLFFPLIRRYGGTVVKTIGDSIMASFKKPANAVKAAIAMQQALQRARVADPSFTIRVRVGVHAGEGLIEERDVYGDVVNVAARLESEAQGDQILVSQPVAERLTRLKVPLSTRGSFVPRGKSEPIEIFDVGWERVRNLAGKPRGQSIVPLDDRQRLELVAYGLLGLAGWLYLVLMYLRYFMADVEWLALRVVNPGWRFAAVGAAVAVAALLALAYLTREGRTLTPRFFKVVKGLAWAALGFAAVTASARLLPDGLHLLWDGALYSGRHVIVTVLAPEPLRLEPSLGAPELRTVAPELALPPTTFGDLYLQADLITLRGTSWTKVLAAPGQWGWLRRAIPPRVGQARVRLTVADTLRLRWYDLYGLVLALAAFTWGRHSFRIRPV